MSDDRETQIEVSLSKGMADRHRLPLSDVIDVLREIQDAVRDVGKAIQRQRGVENPTGDFGIEILADSEGFIFQKNGVKATAVLTRDVRNGEAAFRQVMKTANQLEKKRPASIDAFGDIAVRRLASIAEVQKKLHAELKLSIIRPGGKREEARFGDAGIATTEGLASPDTVIKGIILFGRLRQLLDRSRSEAGGRFFWGELITDGGEIWKVRFANREERHIVPLFRKRVRVEGDARYYKASYPRLSVEKIDLDKPKNYDAAFNRLYGVDAGIYGGDRFEDVMSEMRGDD